MNMKDWPILSPLDADRINKLPSFHGIVTPGMDWLKDWCDESYDDAIAVLVAVRLGFLEQANEHIIKAQKMEGIDHYDNL